MKRRLIWSVAAVCSALAVSSASAGAATVRSDYKSPGLTATAVNNTTVITPLTRQVVATVKLKAGKRRIAFNFSAESPLFKRSTGDGVITEGPTLHALRISPETTFHGFLFGTTFSHFTPDCGILTGGNGDTYAHGGEAGGGIDSGIVLRPGQSVTLRVTYDVAPETPWIGTDYAPKFRLSAMPRRWRGFSARPKGSSTIGKTVVLKTQRPIVVGPVAAAIALDRLPRAAKGKPLAITGRLIPAEAGRQINLEIQGLSGSWPIRVKKITTGSATTDAAGRFSYSGWRPGAGWLYVINASYPEQPGALKPDTMCAAFYSPKDGSFNPNL